MRHTIIIFGVLVVAAGVVSIASFLVREVTYFLQPNDEVAAIKKRLAEIPNVRVTYASDLTKQASQCITAYVEIGGKGQIGFNGLSTSSFGHSSHIRLHGIGPYGFRTRELAKG